MSGNGLYIQLFSLHGLVRGHSQEMGRDADTGGQVKYVIELARALARREDVEQVDLVTRLIEDNVVSPDYSREIEPLSSKARIVRIRCGGRKYLRKELLWPHLEEFIDKTIKFLKKQHRIPDIFHGHYADAGYVAMELGRAFDIPFIFTGHSLGRSKRDKLLGDGLSLHQINKQYAMDTRIHVEEEIIAKAGLIITSTQQEIDRQYGLYENFEKGRYSVIPPGIDLETFYPYYDYQFDSEHIPEEIKQARIALLKELQRFWGHPEKPFILALCRPDHRKNITGLVEAYGTNPDLQAIANLAVFAGIRQNISAMEENERNVLTDMLLQMDRFDLYGKLAIPKKHDFETEVPELYRLCAESRGVFVNPALVEPFGLTLIEASACGLPIVATNDGGPVDIVRNCGNGILVDARTPSAIGDAIKSILVDDQKWDEYSNNGITGVRNHYAWASHCHKMMDNLREVFHGLQTEEISGEKMNDKSLRPSFGKRLTSSNHLIITDIDNTLIGHDDSMFRLLELFDKFRESIAWGVATGRSLELTIEAMTEYDIPVPDILICSVGTEIYYGPDLRMDKGWQQHISHKWRPEQIKAALNDLDFLNSQQAEGQRAHKISYYMEDNPDYLAEIHRRLEEQKLRCQVIYSHGQFLDILPKRASKGKAIKYLKYKYEFPSSKVMVAGDSGNDEDMIRGTDNGLVVGNHSEELEKLRGKPRVYFSRKNYAAGIIEGLVHYGFIPPHEDRE
ncbi:MAG: HAD-IIB family hydrolase [Desulfobulbaceae bacterium]|nr:HAD-IIB family hydrolase [Desulfobulbaceae bacterium]